jgi:PAS domain S-box-containing protein/putative nucleotidyltransferase with HDIG domain
MVDRDRANIDPVGEMDRQFLNALQAARAGHWQYDVERDLFTFNDQFYSIFGTTAEEVGGYTMSSAEYARRFVHPDDIGIVQRAIQKGIETSDPTFSDELEHRALFAGGTEGYILARWFIVKNARGRTVMAFGVNRDVTDLQRQSKRAVESENQFRTMIEQQVAGIVVLRRDGTLAYVNPRFAEILGYQVNELIDRPWIDLIVAEDRSKMAERNRERFAGRASLAPAAFVFRSRSGAPLDLLGQSTLATWEGKPALIGVVIDNSQHKRALRAMEQTIEALASTVELRDPYTAGHQRRVMRVACAIAQELGMSEGQMDGLRIAAAVHDIGKVLVPAEILSKPGELTDIEYQMIRQHAEAGFNILKNVEFPWPVAQIVRQHHERLDGSGYPLGLTSDAILPEAKVLAVADVVDAMTMRRPYREKRGMDAAISEIEAGKGKLYDPAAVNACATLAKQGRLNAVD